MPSNKVVTATVFEKHRQELVDRISQAISDELADCAIPDLDKDPDSGGLWSSLPTVDSKTAFKISASIVEEILGCKFKPAWIRRGGYSSVEDATADVISQLEANCVVTSATATA